MTVLLVNGVRHEVHASSDRPLLAVLRDDLGLTGTKYGCGEGSCGACVVQIGTEPVPACRTPLGAVGGQPVTTVEGLAPPGGLHPAQRAWLEAEALQCGYCTPGWLVETAAWLARSPRPPQAAVAERFERHLCRCGAYPRIRQAIRRAAALADGAAGEDPAPLVGAAPPPEPALPLEIDGAPWDLGDFAQAPMFATLGDGLLAIAAADDGDGAWTTSRGGWVHIGVGGSVTAATGKVEGGQGTRRALALLVGEELGVPAGAVRLVMGDTDACPFDLGTFGSRSIPDAAPLLRAAASAAREALQEAAADPLGARAGALSVADGAVRGPTGAPAIGWDVLLAGCQRVVRVTAGAAAPVVATAWRAAGPPSPVASARGAVLGIRRYPADLTRPGMRHGAILRAPALGARLLRVVTRAAEAIEGVAVIRDGDFAGTVAADPASAARARDRLEAEWTAAPPTTGAGPGDDGPAGASELATFLRAHIRDEAAGGERWRGPVDESAGDPDQALAAAPTRLVSTYTTAYLAHVPLEPRSAVAEWRDGRLTVWVGSQTPFPIRSQLAAALGLAETSVHVVVPDFGGGFGGKHGGAVALEAARLARAAGSPVRVQWSRAEEFTAGYLRPAAVIDVAVGADGSGTPVAWSMTTLNAGAEGIRTPYRVPNRRVRFRPTAAPLAQGSYRALAATANHFARESHMDELARELGADPVAFRQRHLTDARLRAVLATAAERFGWHRPPSGPGTGRGIAVGLEKEGRVVTAAEVAVAGSGQLTIVRLLTAYECGAVVDPANLANQIEGATVMGLGGALFEAIAFRDGRILNASLAHYRVPRLGDVPPIEVVLCDRPDLPSVGAGETPIVAVAPAIANAIRDATGVRLRSLPLAPDGRVPIRPGPDGGHEVA